MFFIFGDGLYGKIDRVPGVFYVATEFLHIFWIPFIPWRSLLVIDRDTGKTTCCFRIRFSIRSALAAWFRSSLGFALFLSLIVCAVGISRWSNGEVAPRPNELMTIGAFPLVTAALLWGSFRFSKASIARARRFAEIAGFDPDQVSHYLTTGEDRPSISLIELKTMRPENKFVKLNWR